MLELNAGAFLGAATNLSRLHQVLVGLAQAQNEPLVAGSVLNIIEHVEAFRAEAEKLGARLSVMAAERLINSMAEVPCPVTVGKATAEINNIESRFADFLVEVEIFALNPQEKLLLQPADALIEQEGFAAKFPSAAFEVEEAAKCIALGRYTASVFHSMRMLEVGIGALRKRLGIPDPTQPAEKNWGLILKTIREKLDELWPQRSRLSGTEGAAFEELYANLEAVRNPWRNATMHVETIYAPHEAGHIIRCAAFFMSRLSSLSDEDGNPPPDPLMAELTD